MSDTVELAPGLTVKKGVREIVIGLDRSVTTDQARKLSERAEKYLPGTRVLFVGGATFATEVKTHGDDLVVAATRMHDALYHLDGVDMLGDDVLTAYGQLQAALKRRGWTP